MEHNQDLNFIGLSADEYAAMLTRIERSCLGNAKALAEVFRRQNRSALNMSRKKACRKVS